MAIHHGEIHSLAGREGISLQIGRKGLPRVNQLPPSAGVRWGEQLLHRDFDLAGVSTIPPRVGKTELQGFNEEVEVGGAVVLETWRGKG